MKINSATAATSATVTSTSQLQRDKARLAADTRTHANAARIAADKAAITKDQTSDSSGSVNVAL